MSRSRFKRENASFVGIRETGSYCVQPDTDKHEEHPTHAIDLEVLKGIRRTVLAIKKRIDAGAAVGNGRQPYPAGDTSSSNTSGPNSGQDRNPEGT
jgi:hypothetical protein